MEVEKKGEKKERGGRGCIKVYLNRKKLERRENGKP